MLRVYFHKYLFALNDRIPNNSRILTLVLLSMALALAAVAGVAMSVKIASAFVALVIFYLFIAAAQT
jgi:hypothetical protein